MELTELETLQGAFTLAFVLVSVLLGLSFVIKYFRRGVIEFLLVGITWMGIVSPYYPDAINFILILWTKNQLSVVTYFFLANALIPPIHITWMLAFTSLYYREHKKKIVTIFAIEAFIFEIVYIFLLFIKPAFIGTQKGPFYTDWELFVEAYLIFSIIVFLITGIMFARYYFKSLSKEAHLKGIFLIIAFISFTVGTSIDAFIIDTFVTASELVIAIARIFLIIAALNFYIGFAMPSWVKNIFIKSEE